MFFWNFRAFSVIQWMLAIWYLVPLPFLNPTCTSGSSQFMYHWSLAWRILSITLLACEMSTLHDSLNTLWHCPSLGLEWKLTFSSPEATVAFFKFVDILSEEHHHLLGSEIAQLEFHHFIISYLKCHFFNVGLVSSPRQNGSGLPLYICSFTLPFF